MYDFAQSVKSREDFIRFVDHLNDNLDEFRSQWENDDLKSFLRGLASFSNDIKGYYQNMGEKVDANVITWRMAAQMLLAAKVYS